VCGTLLFGFQHDIAIATLSICRREVERVTRRFQMSKRGLLTSALVCFVFLAVLSPARGDISTMYPSEGTVGTQFTLSGSGFGAKQGEVLVGA
jgi:hypothetical protein